MKVCLIQFGSVLGEVGANVAAVERLVRSFVPAGRQVTSIEIDNFLTDRDQREEKGIYTLGKEAIHLELFEQGLEALRQGRKITIPRYDFVCATSSHDLDGTLKPGGVPIEIDPADPSLVYAATPYGIFRLEADR